MPPNPGQMPRLTSGWPNTALSEATIQSQARANSQPPPSAKPLTSAITGNGASSSERSVAWPLSANSRPSTGVIELIAAMSAPATNALSPAPVSISTLASGRPATSATAAAIS